MDDKPIPEVIEGLRAITGAIDDGRIEASAVQRAYLEGAIDTLAAVSKRSLCDGPSGGGGSGVLPAH